MNSAAQCDGDFVGSISGPVFDSPCTSRCNPGVQPYRDRVLVGAVERGHDFRGPTAHYLPSFTPRIDEGSSENPLMYWAVSDPSPATARQSWQNHAQSWSHTTHFVRTRTSENPIFHWLFAIGLAHAVCSANEILSKAAISKLQRLPRPRAPHRPSGQGDRRPGKEVFP